MECDEFPCKALVEVNKNWAYIPSVRCLPGGLSKNWKVATFEDINNFAEELGINDLAEKMEYHEAWSKYYYAAN